MSPAIRRSDAMTLLTLEILLIQRLLALAFASRAEVSATYFCSIVCLTFTSNLPIVR